MSEEREELITDLDCTALLTALTPTIRLARRSGWAFELRTSERHGQETLILDFQRLPSPPTSHETT